MIPEGDDGKGLHPAARVRGKACSALIDLCRDPPSTLLARLETVVTEVQRLLSGSHISEMLRRLLTEAIVGLGNALPSIEQHEGYLSHMLQDSIKGLVAIGREDGALAAPGPLLEAGGINPPQENPKEARLRIVHLLTAVAVAFQKTTGRASTADAAAPREMVMMNGSGGCGAGGDGLGYATTRLATPILLATLRIIAAVHRVWGAANDIPLQLRPALAMRHTDAAGLLGKVGRSLPRPQSLEELWFDRSRLWLTSLRESAYAIVRAAAQHGSLYPILLAECEPVLGMLFADFSSMSPQHVTLFIKRILQPAVRYAPRSAAGLATVVRLSHEAFARLHVYLTNGWVALTAASATAAASSGPSAPTAAQLLEQAEEIALLNLTRDVASLLASLLEDATVKGLVASGRPEVQGHALGPFASTVLSDIGAGTCLVDLLVALVASPFSGASRIAADAISAVAEHLIGFPQVRKYNAYFAASPM